jgi:hypothetical protein
MKHPAGVAKIFTVTTNSPVNSFIYVATSFDPKLGIIFRPEHNNLKHIQKLMLSVSVHVSSYCVMV